MIENQGQIDWINNKLKTAEETGFTDLSKEEILAESKARMNG